MDYQIAAIVLIWTLANVNGQECGGLIEVDKAHTIKTPRYPSTYPSETDCEWTIQAPHGAKIKLEFVGRFQLQKSKHCRNDYVIIYDTDYDHEVAAVCGRSPGGPYISSSNVMIIEFHSDKKKNYKGFKAEVIVIHPEPEPADNPFNTAVHMCVSHHDDDPTLSEVEYGQTALEELYGDKVVTSPNYPNKYGKNLDCYFVFTVAKGHILQLDFLGDFNIQKYRSCRRDYLTIWDGYEEEDIVDLCGTDPKGPYKSTTNSLTLHFHTDNFQEYSGFKAKVKLHQPPPNQCGPIALEEDMTINTLNFPEPYPLEYDCVWSVTAPEGKRVKLTFEEFDVEYDEEECGWDFVGVYDGDSSLDVEPMGGKKLCGHGIDANGEEGGSGGPYITTSNQMTIHFHSDEESVEKGFKAILSVV